MSRAINTADQHNFAQWDEALREQLRRVLQFFDSVEPVMVSQIMPDIQRLRYVLDRWKGENEQFIREMNNASNTEE